MPTIRKESWGRLVYDRDADEFEAHVANDKATVLIDRPVSAGCLVTGRCNLACEFCYGNEEALPKVNISPEEWADIFRHLRSWGLMRVDLSGGEPTIRTDLPKIATAAVEVGLSVVISTNGTVLNGDDLGKYPDVRWHVSLDSGIEDVHEASRCLKVLSPSVGSFKKTTAFILGCVERRLRVRVLTCIGSHNVGQLFALGEHLALIGVPEWNLSRILPAGRARHEYDSRWSVRDDFIREQISDIRSAFPFIRVRYSNRQSQNGYFLLVLPDGSLATQRTDGRDKVVLGSTLDMTLGHLQAHPEFNLQQHGEKWIAQQLEWQPFHHLVSPEFWDHEVGILSGDASQPMKSLWF